MSEASPGFGTNRRAGLSLFLAAAILLAGPICRPAAAQESQEIQSIGEVIVRTPPCADVPCRRIYSPERVRGWLGDFVGEVFDAPRIEARIERHYTYIGYKAIVAASLAGSELRVDVLEAPAAVAEISTDQKLMAPFIPLEMLESLEPVDRPWILRQALRTSPGDLVNREKLLQDEYDLSMLGYDLVRIPSPDEPPDAPRRFLIVRRIPRRVWKEMREEAAKSGGPPAGGETPTGGDVQVQPLTRTRIDGSVDYSRRQLFTARLTYQRASSLREYDLLEISPYVARRPAGSVRYYVPWILPGSITHWNLFGELKLYDEFIPDRLFPQKTSNSLTAASTSFTADQENVGATLSLGLEPFRHVNGQSLEGRIYVDRYHVLFSGCTISVNCGGFAATDPNIPGSSQNDIDILGTRFEYSYEHLFSAPRLSWKFIPEAEVATRAWGGDLAFRRISGEIRQHYSFSTGFEIDASWKAGIVDRRVPIFEEFTLGGPDSLRGFLRDDFFGRRFLSIQNDLWIPIPFRAFDRDSDLMAALQRNLKVALLLDGGSVAFEDVRDVHFARGAGIGLRYQAERSPLLVSIDAAWGYWQGVRRFYPYVSLTKRW